MPFVNLCTTEEIKPGKMKGFAVENNKVLVANINGEFFAIGNVCTHMGCLLSRGTLDRENVTCPCHNSSFNVKTGIKVSGPASEPEPKFEVQTENNHVLIKGLKT